MLFFRVFINMYLKMHLLDMCFFPHFWSYIYNMIANQCNYLTLYSIENMKEDLEMSNH